MRILTLVLNLKNSRIMDHNLYQFFAILVPYLMDRKDSLQKQNGFRNLSVAYNAVSILFLSHGSLTTAETITLKNTKLLK